MIPPQTTVGRCRAGLILQDMPDTEHESWLKYRNFVYNKQDIDIPLYFEKREESEYMSIFIYMWVCLRKLVCLFEYGRVWLCVRVYAVGRLFVLVCLHTCVSTWVWLYCLCACVTACVQKDKYRKVGMTLTL